MEVRELTVGGVVAGGTAIARDEGRVVFVAGALPGERVRVGLTRVRRDHAHGRVLEVLGASPDRTAPPCPRVAGGCGGCDWQHVGPAAQPSLKAAVVVDALRRLGGLADPLVTAGPPLPAHGYRTTVRAAVVGGRAGFRRAGTHDVVVAGRCLVAHPLVAEVLEEGEFADAAEVTVRAGAATGERLVVVDPVADGVRVPDDVVVVGRDELRRGRRAWIHEEVAGRRWRISATSFFQGRPDGAGALVEAVLAAASPLPEGAATVVDAYSGVGLLAGALATPRAEGGSGRRRVVAVERGRSAVADARHNLADLDVEVVRAPVERARLPVADLVVADPARSGLGAEGVRALARCAAPRIVLVSCDPASLGRDAALLAEAGYRHDGTVLVDLFPQTHHLEAVSTFVADRSHHPRHPGRPRAPKKRVA